MYYEQRINSIRLSIIESVALKFCGKNSKKNVDSPQPTTSGWNPWNPSPQRHPFSPNSWPRQNYGSPIKPLVEDTKIEPDNENSPKTAK